MTYAAFAGFGKAGEKVQMARKSDNSPEKLALGARMREARDRAGLDQFQLAIEIGKRPEQVSRWERGEQMPGADVVGAIAKATGCNGSWLLTGALQVVTSEPVQDEELSELDRALAPFRGQLTPDIEAHIRRRHVEAKAFLGGGSMGRLVTFVEEEIAAWKRQHDGMPPKVKEAPATEVTVREGAMKREPKSKGRRA